MKKSLPILGMLLVALLSDRLPVKAASDDFNVVVKLIEQFYHVKHQNLPLLARATVKAATTAARIRGGDAKRLAEAGSARVVYFEDQDFNSRGGVAAFQTSLTNAVSATWSPLIQTLSAKDDEQTYIFVRDAGEKFSVLVVTIDRREATVVQVNLKPRTLAMLLRDPDEMGKAITNDAARDDN